MKKIFHLKKEEKPVASAPRLESFPDFTKKEIFTQGALIAQMLGKYINADKICLDFLKIKTEKIKRVYLVGSGTDYSCALCGAYNFEVLLDVVSVAVPTGEFLCSNPILDKNTLVVLLGDNGDALKRARDSGAKAVQILNFGSEKDAITIDHKTLGSFPTAEYSLKMTALVLLALYLGEKKKVVTSLYIKISTQMLLDLKNKIKAVLEQEYVINGIAQNLDLSNMLITGTNVDYAVALYGSGIFDCGTETEIPAVSFGEISPFQRQNKSLLALASNVDFYDIFNNCSNCQLKIAPDAVRKIDEKTFIYEETIPLLNPILNSVVLQMIVYYLSEKNHGEE